MDRISLFCTIVNHIELSIHSIRSMPYSVLYICYLSYHIQGATGQLVIRAYMHVGPASMWIVSSIEYHSSFDWIVSSIERMPGRTSNGSYQAHFELDPDLYLIQDPKLGAHAWRKTHDGCATGLAVLRTALYYAVGIVSGLGLSTQREREKERNSLLPDTAAILRPPRGLFFPCPHCSSAAASSEREQGHD
jgi:hypothetical protein